MNKRQAKRLATWVNGIYLTQIDHSGLSDVQLATISAEDHDRIADATFDLGLELIARTGIPREATFEQAMAMVMDGTSDRKA